MRTLSVSPCAAFVGLLAVSSASGEPRSKTVVVPVFASGLSAARVRLIEEVLAEAASGSMSPTALRQRLASHQRLGWRRSKAQQLLQHASALNKQVRYSEAMAALQRAEKLARWGLARLVDPALLAEIHLQKGISRLAADQPAALMQFRLSCLLRPSRRLTASGFSPKIVAAFERARATLQQRRYPALTLDEALEVARATGAQRLLAVDGSTTSAADKVWIRLLQVRTSSWTWSARFEVRHEAGKQEIRNQLRRHLPPDRSPDGASLFDEDRSSDAEKHRPGRSSSRRWVALGLAIAGGTAAVVGGVLGLTAKQKEQDAEELAGGGIEYSPFGQELEVDGRRLERGAIVSFVVAGAAAVAAVMVWLWPTKRVNTATAPSGFAVSWGR